MLLLGKQIDQSRCDNLPFSIVMMDIDNLKKINDTYGHNYGDEILKTVSQVLKNNLGDHDIVFRHGGDEFIYFLPNMDREEAFLVSRRIREGILKFFKDHEKNICRHISASFGIAVFPDDGDSVDHLINRADSAMYKVKRNGRNGIGLVSGI